MTITRRTSEVPGSRTFRPATRKSSRPPQHDPPETLATLAPVREGSVSRDSLLRALTALLLEVIADERQARRSAAEAALAPATAHLPGVAIGPAPSAGEPAWPREPLTQSETRVLRYLPTHLGTPEIAAELCLSTNTVKTHLQHVYRKLSAHSRHEAVARARAIGLFTQPSRRHLHPARTAGPAVTHPAQRTGKS